MCFSFWFGVFLGGSVCFSGTKTPAVDSAIASLHDFIVLVLLTFFSEFR